jgi:hypothetical protein
MYSSDINLLNIETASSKILIPFMTPNMSKKRDLPLFLGVFPRVENKEEGYLKACG